MELSEITLKNIKSFIQGYARSYLDKICLLPLHIREQVFYRIYTCSETCIPFHKCEKCKCPAIEKSYSTTSCNLDKFPNLMPRIEWEEYKINKGISDEVITVILEKVRLIFNK